MKEKNKDRRNTLAGPAYEREIIEKINAIGIFPELGRSATINSKLDEQKIDIIPIDPKLFDDFVYNIQAKSATRTVPYAKLLSELSTHKGVPVIFHKKTKRVENNRFLPEGNFVILYEKDFLNMIHDLERHKLGYYELHCYFDSVSDEEKPLLHERLKKLGL